MTVPARSLLTTDDYRVPALLQLAGEEARHIELFAVSSKRSSAGSARSGMAILHIEWMTQSHYLNSVRDDGVIDPLFESLMRDHWMGRRSMQRLTH